MAQGVVVVAVADRQAGGVVTDELERRYGGDYRVVRSYSASAAVGVLEKLAEERESVAVLLADKAAAEEENNLLLATCRERHPTAKRGLLVGAADPAATPIILRLMAVGLIDTFVPIPQRSPDEQFHRAISEFLEEWASGHLPAPDVVTIVGERWNQRSYELRDLLGRAGVPYTFHDARSAEGREVLTAHGMAGGTAPVVVIGGQAVANPSTEQLADALGASVDVASETHDVTVVGAGPAGLSAAVYAASEGLRTLVIEEGAFGGQAASSSLIRNYLGFPHGVSGAELARRAYGQAVIFGAAFHFGRRAVDLYPDNQVLRLGLSDGSSLWTRSVVIATGVAWRRLDVPSLEARVGAGVFYGAAVSEAKALEGEVVYVVGGGNSAGQAAVHLARYARRVTVLVRGNTLASSMSEYLIRQLQAAPNIAIRYRTKAVDGHGSGRLERLTLADPVTGAREEVPASGLFVLIGAEPSAGWLRGRIELDTAGYVLTGSEVTAAGGRPGTRSPFLLETSVPGVFAAGDVRSGSIKRVASAVGEGALAIQLCHQYLAAPAFAEGSTS